MLNNFLNTSLNDSGNLRDNTVFGSTILDGTITGADISNLTNITIGMLGIGTTSSNSLLTTGISFGTNEVNLSGLVYVNSTSGNVGIGTTTPTQTLDVRGNGNFSGTIYINNNTDINATFYSINSTLNIQNLINTTNINFGNINASSALIGTLFANSSSVGIGTSSPASLLHIVSDVNSGVDFELERYQLPATIIFRTANGNFTNPNATVSGDQLFAIGARGYGATGFASSGRAALFAAAGENWTDNAQGTYLSFTTTLNGTKTAVERLRIDNTGYVGIGTLSPTYQLSVGNGSSTSSLLSINRLQSSTNLDIIGYYNNSNDIYGYGVQPSTNLFRIYSNASGLDKLFSVNLTSGYVGIGTTTPSNTLDVRGQGNFSGTIYINNATDVSLFASHNTTLNIQNLINTSNINFGNINGSSALIGTLFVNSTNVGIGTLTPNATLDIASSSFLPLKINDDTTPEWLLQSRRSDGTQLTGIYEPAIGTISLMANNNSRLTVNGSFVGIGTDNPSVKLDVRGVGNFSGTIYINNATDVSTFSSSLVNTTLNIQNLINSTIGQYTNYLNSTAAIQSLGFYPTSAVYNKTQADANWTIGLSMNTTLTHQQLMNSTIGQYIGYVNTTLNLQTILNTTNAKFNSINVTTSIITANVTAAYLVGVSISTLPACGTGYNGTIMRNVTGLFYCNSTASWAMMMSG